MPIAPGSSRSAAVARATALRTGPERHPPAAPGQTKSACWWLRSVAAERAVARALLNDVRPRA